MARVVCRKDIQCSSHRSGSQRACWLPAMAMLLVGALITATTARAEGYIIWDGINDPNLKEALYESYTGQHFNAITQLRAAQKLNRVHNQQQAALVLGGLYLSYGFTQEAVKIFETLLREEPSQSVRDQAWYYLAKTYYQTGEYQRALEAVTRIKDGLDFNLSQQRYLLQANILMQQNQYAEALKILANITKSSDWELYARYNRGVSTYKLGKQQEGIALLDQVGNINPDSDEMRALKEKANLVLGFGLLETNQPDLAQSYLQRMKLQGPFSSRALLALGRSYSDKKMHEKSLVPWLKLIERDTSDPAVQDALMAVPFAFGQLEAYKQSLEYYEKAMTAFQEEIKNINMAAEAVAGGKLLDGLVEAEGADDDSDWKLRKLLDSPEGHYLWPLLMRNEFRKTLHNYSQLQLSLDRFEGWSALLSSYKMSEARRRTYLDRITKLQTKVLLAVEKQRHHLQKMAYDELKRRKSRLVNYFNEARFSVAQIYDYAAKRWGAGNEK